MSMYADMVDVFQKMQKENEWDENYTAEKFIEATDALEWDEETVDDVVDMFTEFKVGEPIKVLTGKYATEEEGVIQDTKQDLVLVSWFDENGTEVYTVWVNKEDLTEKVFEF